MANMVAIILLFVISGLLTAQASPLIEKKYEVSSVRMTIDDMDEILTHVRSLTKKANSGVREEYVREKISLSHQGHTVSLEEWKSLKNESSIPGYVTEVWYWYEASRESPISEVQLNLNNSYRVITIKGSDRSQVDAVSAVLNSKLEEHSNFFMETPFKVFCGITSIIIGVVLVNLRKNNRIVPSVTVLGLFLLVAPSVLPWGEWMPSVAIFSGQSGFIDRNINLISVFGVVLALISLIVPAIKSVYRNK